MRFAIVLALAFVSATAAAPLDVRSDPTYGGEDLCASVAGQDLADSNTDVRNADGYRYKTSDVLFAGCNGGSNSNAGAGQTEEGTIGGKNDDAGSGAGDDTPKPDAAPASSVQGGSPSDANRAQDAPAGTDPAQSTPPPPSDANQTKSAPADSSNPQSASPPSSDANQAQSAPADSNAQSAPAAASEDANQRSSASPDGVSQADNAPASADASNNQNAAPASTDANQSQSAPAPPTDAANGPDAASNQRGSSDGSNQSNSGDVCCSSSNRERNSRLLELLQQTLQSLSDGGNGAPTLMELLNASISSLQASNDCPSEQTSSSSPSLLETVENLVSPQ